MDKKTQNTQSTNPLLIVVSGPSGVGKDTVLANLRCLEPSLKQIITVTTRPPRRGERDGREYYFVSSDCFENIKSAAARRPIARKSYVGLPAPEIKQFT